MDNVARRLRRMLAFVLCVALVLDPAGLRAYAITVTDSEGNTVSAGDSGPWVQENVTMQVQDGEESQNVTIESNFFDNARVTFDGEDDLSDPNKVYTLLNGTQATGDLSPEDASRILMDGSSEVTDSGAESFNVSYTPPSDPEVANVTIDDLQQRAAESESQSMTEYLMQHEDLINALSPNVTTIQNVDEYTFDTDYYEINGHYSIAEGNTVIVRGSYVKFLAGVTVGNGASIVGENVQGEGDEIILAQIQIEGRAIQGGYELYAYNEDQLVAITPENINQIPDDSPRFEWQCIGRENNEDIFGWVYVPWGDPPVAPPVAPGNYKVYYDTQTYRDEGSTQDTQHAFVKVGGNVVNEGNEIPFGENTSVTFTLEPPSQRVGDTPIVEVHLFRENGGEIWYSSDEADYNRTDEGRATQLVISNNAFTVADLAQGDSFEVSVEWSAFDRVRPGEDEIMFRVSADDGVDIVFVDSNGDPFANTPNPIWEHPSEVGGSGWRKYIFPDNVIGTLYVQMTAENGVEKGPLEIERQTEGYSNENPVQITSAMFGDRNELEICAFAQGGGDPGEGPHENRTYNVVFTGAVAENTVTYTVGEANVVLTVNAGEGETVTIANDGSSTISDTTGFVLSDNYNPDTMAVRVTEIREGDNPGFWTDLGVAYEESEYRTGITALPEDTNLPGECDFRIEVTLRDNNSQGSGEGPGQDQTIRIKINGAIGNNGTTASSFINSTAVVITVPEGRTIDESGYTQLSREDVLTISGFNSETMDLKIVGENNYNSELAVSNNSFSLNGLNLPEGNLTIMVQAKSSGGGQEPQQNEPQPPVDLDLNAGDLGIVISNLRYGAVQYKIGTGSWTTVSSDTITVTAAQLSAAGATNGTSIYFKATPNSGQYFDTHEGGNEVKINNVSQGLVESDLLALAGDTGWSYTYDSTKTFQIRIAFDGHDNIAFNGKMIFAWKGAGGALCMHTINDISGRRITSGGEAYDINYILLSTIKDDTTNEQYVIGNNDYMWVWEGRGAEIEALNITTWSVLCSYTNSLSENDKRAFIADPTFARNGNATVCTNGDRNFRATIYDATKFVGIAFKADESEYTYFPDFWDPTFFSNVLDITDTTASNPAMYETSILEPSLIFSTDTRSVDTISAVRAVGIPQKAISVTNSNGQISVVLRSNFYSQVLLELEGESGRKYYVKIIRKSMNVMDDMGPGSTDNHVIAELYYDENKSYSDYDVYCTKYYSDGSTAVVQCEAADIEYALNGDEVPVNTKVIPAGKGLKKSQYMVPMESGVVSYSFNVTNSGAMTGDTFGGSFVGSSKGVTYTDRVITY
ncbi:MAG: hypothetical protein K6D96_08255 [Acetatifactor sp.]|nr:hypothetical protein [Acetatifactor sp.]